MSWSEIIAQLDEEIGRLQRARDFLAATAPATSKAASSAPTRRPAPAKKSKKPQARKEAVPVANGIEKQEMVAPTPAPQLPEVQRVPPKRRIERRVPQRVARAEKAEKPAVALGGTVPSGPVVVSADEARKAQERNANAAPNAVPPPEPPAPIGSERSLGALVRAFERSARLSGVGTP